jgi:uncharacterized protein YgiB involved in biofilm formation
MDLHGFGASALAFVVAFVAAGLFTVIFKIVYQWVTPYNEGKLIREGNVAAALALGGALVGYVLPLASALSNTVTLLEFCAWAALAGRAADRRLHPGPGGGDEGRDRPDREGRDRRRRLPAEHLPGGRRAQRRLHDGLRRAMNDHSSFPRRRLRSSSLALTGLMAGTAISVSACDDPGTATQWGDPPAASREVDAKTYASLADCKSSGDMTAEQCDTAYAQAQKDSAANAPKFGDQQSCEERYGVDQCVPRNNNSGGSFFTPLLTGFIVGQALNNMGGGYFGAPMYRDRERDLLRRLGLSPVARLRHRPHPRAHRQLQRPGDASPGPRPEPQLGGLARRVRRPRARSSAGCRAASRAVSAAGRAGSAKAAVRLAGTWAKPGAANAPSKQATARAGIMDRVVMDFLTLFPFDTASRRLGEHRYSRSRRVSGDKLGTGSRRSPPKPFVSASRTPSCRR